MNRRLFCLLTVALSIAAWPLIGADDPQTLRHQASQHAQKGNWKDAYQIYRKLCLDPKYPDELAAADFNQAINCLNRLGRVAEVDTFRDGVIEAHGDDYRTLRAVAQSFRGGQHWGHMIAGEFQRGAHRGRAKYVNAWDRDRVRGLRLMKRAMDRAEALDQKKVAAQIGLELGQFFLQYRHHQASWRLQVKTDLDELPDYEPGYGYYHGGTQGAPVDAEGNPVFYAVPASFEKADNDGERYRWLLKHAADLDQDLKDQTDYVYAGFLHQQFGVQTMAQYSRYFHWGARGGEKQDKEDEQAPFAVHTLEDGETLARLATGVKRFKLPDEHNFIKIYQSLSSDLKRPYAQAALRQLGGLFENRRQFDRAAAYWTRAGNASKTQQILGAWGAFEPMGTHPAGSKPKVDYRYRNAERVEFRAYRIRVKALLEAAMDYIAANPQDPDWNRTQLRNIGWRLVNEDLKRFVEADPAASWGKDLKPDPRHWDTREVVEPPLEKAGAYLLTAQVPGGNTSRVIVWIADTAIVRKALEDKRMLYYVADSVTGKPLPGLELSYFGWRREHKGNRRFEIDVARFKRHTDGKGQVIVHENQQSRRHQWLVTAEDNEGRLAYLGFQGVWYPHYGVSEYAHVKAYGITDRPVYRPTHKVQMKVWLRHAKYDQDDVSACAGREATLKVQDPKGTEVFKKSLRTDDYGGVTAEYVLPDKAALGMYRMTLHGPGGQRHAGTFRVEEYKKPEFEVKIEAPEKPVMLGEKITATIRADYYFGAPVTQATVNYKITRDEHDARWYPNLYWDWFYGAGYWWYGYDYTWYPGWKRWGCVAPIWGWWPHRNRPPEIVAEGEAPIGPDGTLRVEIDTALAKALRGDEDHRYSITAEVRDQSRRTIVGTGEVLVAREPFRIYSWVDRGHYRVGDKVTAHFKAQTLDRKPVQGEGRLILYRIQYAQDGTPKETEVKRWDLDTDERGLAEQTFQAAQAGQFRLSYMLNDDQEHAIEGGYVFAVRGEGDDGSDYRFAKLELVPDKKQYAPGERINLRINADRPDVTVLLFPRAANGVVVDPQAVRLEGKSAEVEIPVAQVDMPNFFIEALTVYGGEVHNEVRRVVVPPEKRVLKVAVEPSKTEYKPGEAAQVRVRLTDLFGEPFVGSTVISVYDRSIDYIAGGAATPEIREFFWKWLRHHRPQTVSSLQRWFNHIGRPNEVPMQSLGVFGHIVSNDFKEEKQQLGGQNAMREGAAKSRGLAMADAAMEAAPAAPAAAFAARKQAVDKSEATSEAMVQPQVRSKFADTAFWAGALTPGPDGWATVDFKMPENLTGWKIRAWGMGHGTRVGEGSAEVVTKKNLLVRLQAPRFFVQKDEVVISANVHNYLKNKKTAQVEIELVGSTLALLDKDSIRRTVSIDPDGEARVDWRVAVKTEGEALIRVKALTDEESDAMEMRFPVYVHGFAKQVPASGVIRPDGDASTVSFTVPAERRVADSRLEVRYSPTLAGAMVDALPYMVSYPYGCTEQTLNRFLPTAIVQRILMKDMGLDLKQIREKRTNLNAQEIGDDAKRAAQWKRRHWKHEPVFDEDTVADMVREGIDKLSKMQLSDGGWGWFSGWGERSWPHTTATVVRGLQVARDNDVALPKGMLEAGVAWLKRHQKQQLERLILWEQTEGKKGKRFADNLDALIYMILVDAEFDDRGMGERIYRDRNQLAVYGKSMLGMALHQLDRGEELAVVMKNIEQYLVEDDENQTAYLKLPNQRYWWYWYGSEFEAHAYYLKLLSKTEPKARKTSRLVKYLLNNRKHGNYWNSTRDTALCIEALGDYLRASGEAEPDMTVGVYLDGDLLKEVKISKANLFSFDNKVVLEGAEVTTGDHKLEIRRSGKGPVYFNAYLDYFTLEDHITKAGLEVKIERKVYRLKPVDKKIDDHGARGQVLGRKVEKFEREPLGELDRVVSGDLIEIELAIESKNDYEYILIEDLKAAGFEPVQVRSGYNGNDMGAYVEFRDERVSFFTRMLMRGKHSVSYRLRAEIPGRFSALPARAYGMYAPELKGNSDEIKLIIEDQPAAAPR